MNKLKSFALTYLRPQGKQAFLLKLNKKSKILDLGCGNASVLGIKSVLPDCEYFGIDVEDYNQTEYTRNLMDHYIICDSNKFAKEIKKIKVNFDAVISCHNLEHCDDLEETLKSIIEVTGVNGSIYLSFPSNSTINYPSRIGTLNYFDDNTHKDNPPNFEKILSTLEQNGCEISFSIEQYKPFLLRVLGLLLEPASYLLKRNLPGTWELYGFESVIHAKKLRSL